MSTKPELVGAARIFPGAARGNPIGLYLRREGDAFSITLALSPWNRMVGVGETVNEAAKVLASIFELVKIGALPLVTLVILFP